MNTFEKLRLYLFPKTVYESSDKELRIVDRIENGEAVRVLFVKGARESGIYLEESKRADPLFYYMRTFKDICTRNEGIHHVLMIGGAGLSFARVFLHLDRKNTMTVIEKDQRFIEIADRYFGIRADDRLSVHVMPGERYIAEVVQHKQESDAPYDAIIIDAFDGKKIAKELTTESVLKMMSTLLNPEGLFIMNAINDSGGNIAMHTYLTEEFLKKLFSHTEIIECENEGNCVLIASGRKI